MIVRLCWLRSGVTRMKKTQGRRELNKVLVASSFDFDLAVLRHRDSETRTAVLPARALDLSGRRVFGKKPLHARA